MTDHQHSRVRAPLRTSVPKGLFNRLAGRVNTLLFIRMYPDTISLDSTFDTCPHSDLPFQNRLMHDIWRIFVGEEPLIA